MEIVIAIAGINTGVLTKVCLLLTAAGKHLAHSWGLCCANTFKSCLASVTPQAYMSRDVRIGPGC